MSDSWGYHTYDVDDSNNDDDNSSDDNLLGYTRYNRNGGVDSYHDNGDGGHSHDSWDSADDFNSGEDPDYSRSDSNNSDNDFLYRDIDN